MLSSKPLALTVCASQQKNQIHHTIHHIYQRRAAHCYIIHQYFDAGFSRCMTVTTLKADDMRADALEAFLMVLDAPHSWDRGLKASTENSITGLKWFLLAWIYTKWIYFHTVVLSVFNHPQDSKRSMKILMTDVPRRIQWSILFENPLLRFIFCVLLFVFSSLLQGNLKTSTAGSAYQAQLESQAKLHLRKQHSSWSSLTPLLASLLKWII